MDPVRRRNAIALLRGVVGYVLLGLFLAMVLVWTLFGFDPHLVDDAPELVRSLGDPGAFWPIFVAFVAGAVATWMLSTSIRTAGEASGDGEVRLSPIVAGVLGASALLLGFAAYWPCSGGESPVWAGLRHALEVFEGIVYEPYGHIAGCPTEIPQGLQAAALFALVTVVLTVALAVAYVFQRSLHRVQAYAARSVVVFAGLDEESTEAARMIRRNLTPKQRLLILDPSAGAGRARSLAREIGALVLTIDVADPASVRRFAAARGKRGIQGLYLLSPDSATNLEALDAFLEEGQRQAGRARGTEVPGRAVVRVDNPWHAEDWRRTRMIGNHGWLFDAISVHEMAARHVVQKLRTEHTHVDAVVIDGGSAFNLAVLSELAFEHRVDQVLRAASAQGEARWSTRTSAPPYMPYTGSTPNAVLVGAQAEDTAAHFREQLQRYGISNFDEAVRVLPGLGAVEAMVQLEAGGGTPALIVQDSSERDATFLAVRHPGWTIFDWSSRVHGVTDKPLLGGLSMVGPTLRPVPGYGLDIWDRLGSIQHQVYLLGFAGGMMDPRSANRGTWEPGPGASGLSPFTRESNIRSFATFTRNVGQLARPRVLATDLGPHSSQDAAPLDEAELLVLAMGEHRSWVLHHLEHGYRYGPVRKGRRHPDMVSWERLSEEDRDKDAKNVLATSDLLKALGFVLADS